MSDSLVKADRLVTVFGGSGFVGRHVVRALAKAGWRVRVATRRPDLAFFLQPGGKVGQIHAVQANIRYPESIAAAVQGADAVINLVGILSESGVQNFSAIHTEAAAAVAKAAAQAGAHYFVQMSALGASDETKSDYAQSKFAGEQAVLSAFPKAVILRPSVIFGPEDGFFNRFASLATVMPALPLIGGGHSKLQPVFVGDVAEAVVKSLSGDAQGKIFELGGPQEVTLRDVMHYVCAVTGRSRLLAPLPFGLASILGFFSEIAAKLSLGLIPPQFLITRDQVALLRQDNVVSDAALYEKRTLVGLGITPTGYETIMPPYLSRFRKTGQFADQRAI